MEAGDLGFTIFHQSLLIGSTCFMYGGQDCDRAQKDLLQRDQQSKNNIVGNKTYKESLRKPVLKIIIDVVVV